MHGFVAKIKIMSDDVDEIVAIYDENEIKIQGEWDDDAQMWVMKFYCNVAPNTSGYYIKIKWITEEYGQFANNEDLIYVNEREYKHCRKYVLDRDDGIRDA